MNSKFEMPYSFIFTDEELCDLWSYYRRISQIIRNVELRHKLVITDEEAHAGAYFRARALLAEAQRRESLQGNALMPRVIDPVALQSKDMPPFETIKILGE